jgi:hypothetical protein
MTGSYDQELCMSHVRSLVGSRRLAVADGPSSGTPIARRTTARAVPRWAIRAAHAAALCPVPSALWRLPLMFGFSMGMDAEFMSSMNAHPFWQRAAYLLGLGVISEGAALLTLGLVRWWGETVPRWFPFVAGRRIPPAVAIVPATLGGIAATFFGFAIAVTWPADVIFANGWTVLMTACYLPLVLWGPLVLAVTFAYYQRRRRSPVGETARDARIGCAAA